MADDTENLVPVVSLEVVPVDLASIERLSGSELLSPGTPRRIEPWTPAAAYLASLSTIISRRSMVSSLNKAAKILCGKPDWRVVKPLTDFLRNSRDHIARLRESGRAEVLTVNGEAAVVGQDIASYEQLRALAERTRQDDRLREAIAAVKSGEPAEPAEAVFRRLREKLRAE